jgi:hypothetical protein
VPLVETLEFPEAVGQELTLRRGLGVLVDGLLARPERAGRPPRKLALWGRLVGGASWRRTVTLREATADPARLRLALGPKLAEVPAPVLKLRLEVVELAESTGEQLELVGAEGEARSSAQAGSRWWWRWRPGRAFRKHARCSFPATTERTPTGARRGTCRRDPAPGQPAGGRARP